MTRKTDKIENITGVILAGGQSKRFGQDKLQMSLGGRPLLTWILDAMRQVFTEVCLITSNFNLAFTYDVPVQPDVVPGNDSIGGLQTALVVNKKAGVFLVAGDMPFVEPDCIREICTRINNYDVIVPQIEGSLQPLHAYYSQNCLPHIDKLIFAKNLKITDFYSKVNAQVVEESELRNYGEPSKMFMNINTQEDFVQAEEIISSR